MKINNPRSELMVTITLNEYRRLVQSDATRSEAIDNAEYDKWQRAQEVNKLKEEVTRLTRDLLKYTLAERKGVSQDEATETDV